MPKFSVYMSAYYLQQHTPKTQILVSKIPSLSCVHTLYNNTSMNAKTYGQNAQYFVFKIPI